jgi:hypothetical protein
MKSGKIMNPFERSIWILFVFVVNIFLMAFIFLAERTSYSHGIKTDDETGKIIAVNIDETETK